MNSLYWLFPPLLRYHESQAGNSFMKQSCKFQKVKIVNVYPEFLPKHLVGTSCPLLLKTFQQFPVALPLG